VDADAAAAMQHLSSHCNMHLTCTSRARRNSD
jgi:hypothetical protein